MLPNLHSRFRRTADAALGLRSCAAILCAAAVLGLWPSPSYGQPCCAGASVLSPARLTPLDDALVGLQARGARIVGSFDAAGRYLSAPAGANELDLEQDLIGTLRVLQRGQLSVSVPILQTIRTAGGTSEFGGGLGDIAVSGRYDAVLAGEYEWLPGLAILAGVVFPTGKPLESASLPLGSDSTGTGAFQGTLGLAVEQIWGHLFANLTLLALKSAPRHVGGISTTLGFQGTASAAGGYVFDSGGALALTIVAMRSTDAVQDGKAVLDSSRGKTLLGMVGAFPLSARWRIQGSLTGDLPFRSMGKNEPAGVGLSLLIMRTWQ